MLEIQLLVASNKTYPTYFTCTILSFVHDCACVCACVCASVSLWVCVFVEQLIM